MRLGAGIADDDRRWVLDALESLVPHLPEGRDFPLMRDAGLCRRDRATRDAAA
jgi:hypothetical protein